MSTIKKLKNVLFHNYFNYSVTTIEDTFLLEENVKCLLNKNINKLNCNVFIFSTLVGSDNSTKNHGGLLKHVFHTVHLSPYYKGDSVYNL